MGSRRFVLLATALGGALLAVPPLVAAAPAATTRAKTLSPLQQGIDFYRGKTVTFVAPDSPGGGFYTYTQDYAPYLAAYLHATINIESIPQGNTIAGQDAVDHASANGLTIGWLDGGPDVEDTVLNLPALNFNPVHVAMLGSSASSPSLVASSTQPACSAWTSWAAVVHDSSAANPVTEPIQTTGATTFDLVLLNGVFGVHAKVIPGYQSTAQLVQGFTRGDGCVIINSINSIAPLIQGGKGRALLVTVPVEPTNGYYSVVAGVPTISRLEKTLGGVIKTKLQRTGEVTLNQAANTGTARVLFAPGNTPVPQVTALRAAFKWASFNKSLQSLLVQQGFATGYSSGPVAKVDYEQFLDAAKGVVAYLAPLG